MTSQIQDVVHHEGKAWYFASPSGDGFFHPERLGVSLYDPHTALYRGYLRAFCIDAGRLYLERLVLYVTEPPPSDLMPTAPVVGRDGAYCYERMRHPVPFTGIWTLVDPDSQVWPGGMIDGIYPSDFDVTLRLAFEGGRLLEGEAAAAVFDEADRRAREAEEKWQAEYAAAEAARRAEVASRQLRSDPELAARVQAASREELAARAEERDGTWFDGACRCCGEERSIRVNHELGVLLCSKCYFAW